MGGTDSLNFKKKLKPFFCLSRNARNVSQYVKIPNFSRTFSMSSRRTPNDVPRNAGWVTLVHALKVIKVLIEI